MIYLGRLPLWTDELHTLLVASDPSWLAPFKVEIHPPLYYLLMQWWIGLFGASDIGLRLPSVMVGVGLVLLAWGVGREVFRAPGAGLMAAAVTAVAPLEVAYSQEAKAYTLLAAWQLGAILLTHRAWRTGGSAPLLGAVGLMIGAFYTHFFAVYAAVGIGLFLLVFKGRGKLRWPQLGVAGLVGAGAVLPWMAFRLSEQTRFVGSEFNAGLAFNEMKVMLLEATSITTGAGLVLVPLALVGVLAGTLRLGRSTRGKAGTGSAGSTVLLVTMAVTPVLLSWLFAYVLKIALSGFARYVVGSAVLLSVLAGYGVYCLPRRAVRVSAALLLAAALGWGLSVHHRWPYKLAYRAAAQRIARMDRDRPVVLVVGKDHSPELLLRYLPPDKRSSLVKLRFRRPWVDLPRDKPLPPQVAEAVERELAGLAHRLRRAEVVVYLDHDDWEWTNLRRAYLPALRRALGGQVYERALRLRARRRNGFDSHHLVLRILRRI